MAKPELWDEFSERLRDLETAEHAPEIISPFLALPGLRAFYPMSAVGTAGEARDLGGSGATYDLTRNGGPVFGYSGLVPLCIYNGVNDYHSLPDNANFDILGNEAYVGAAARGLALGGWFRFDDDPPAAAEALIAKWTATPNRAYLLQRVPPSTAIVFTIDDTVVNVASTATTTSGVWYFLWGRYNPGAVQMSVGVNDVIVTGASLAAPITNSNADFTIAATGVPGNYMDGWVSLVFVCVEQLSDGIMNSLFQQTRGAFGV